MTITEKYNALLNERVYKQVHPSGLEIYFLPKKDYSMKYAFFGTKYGSLYNTFEDVKTGEVIDMPMGIAHFLEHKIFEESEGNIFEEFAKLGANVNAYTNFQSTIYMFSTVDNFYPSLSLLMDFVQSPHLTDENVEKEKGIIAQEIKMYDDNPDWRIFFNALTSLYHKHPVKEDIAGTVKSVNDTTKDQLQMCYDSFYTPNNMIVFIIGDLEKDEVFASVDKSLKAEFLEKRKMHNIVLPNEPELVKVKREVQKMDVPVPLFSVNFKDIHNPLDSGERLKKGLAVKLGLDMVFGKGSRFYEENYDSGMINYTFSSDYSYGRTYAHTLIGGESEDPDKAIENILKEIQKVKVEGMDRDDFERSKKKTIGRYLSSFNSIQYIANSFISYMMKDIDMFDYLEVLGEIELDYVFDQFITHFDNDNYSVALIN